MEIGWVQSARRLAWSQCRMWAAIAALFFRFDGYLIADESVARTVGLSSLHGVGTAGEGVGAHDSGSADGELPQIVKHDGLIP